MASVTSGLGRNGPWLQNDWLRVETRQDDGSISPVSLAAAFRPTERALGFVQPVTGPALRFERANYDVQPYEDIHGSGRRLVLMASLPRHGLALRREVVLYDRHPYCVTRLAITNESAAPLALASLHVFATAEARGALAFHAPPDDWRIYRHGWQSWSPTLSMGGRDVDVQARVPDLAPVRALQQPGRFASDDVGVLYDPVSGRSLLVGTISARDFLTQIYVDAPAKSMDARCLADGASVMPGETLWSERCLIDLVGHPNDQLARYGDALGLEMGARVPPTTPSGWCSWYYFFTQVTEEDVLRNLRFLESHRREWPIDTVQIDDGYQSDIGDWLTVNEKFPRGMAWLAAEIKRSGYTPGIWLAPFLLAESSRTFAEHPDWVVRDQAGEPVLACENWQRREWGLDGSHPEARDWLTSLFSEVCDGWGYEYVKIDFLFGAAVAGLRHDANTTRVRAYRSALAAVRAGVGEQRFILGCGALMAPSVGVFDGNRIGPDVAPFWRFLTTEERASAEPRPRTPNDHLSAETAIRNTLARSWMHGRLWANDPDCVLVRTDRTKLTLDETRSLATAIGLSAGMMLSSDDLERVPAERLELISMLLPPLSHAAVPVDLMLRDIPETVAWSDPADPDRQLVGLFNFADEARDLALELSAGRWHAFELWTERYLGVVEGQVEFALVEPHACRMISLRRDTGHPVIVATTAHIGMGVADVATESWTKDDRALRAVLLPIGRAERQIIVVGNEPAAARVDGSPVPCERTGAGWALRLTVDAAANLEVDFG